MSAGAFHSKVENEMKEMGKVCDFLNFVRCVQRTGDDVIMEVEDFKKYEIGINQGKASKKSRRLLENVSVLRFLRKVIFLLNLKLLIS